MAKFVFKLQALLNIKLQMEEQMKNDLGKAIQKLEHEKAVLSGIEKERDDHIDSFNEQSKRGIVVEKLREYTAYISHLRERIEFQKDNINFAQRNVDNYREQLIKVVQERKMLEKLKEKRYEDYTKEQLQAEQKLNDEMASFKYMERDST